MVTEEVEMRCFKCRYNLSEKDDGMIINEGHSTEMYLCDDCHYMEFGVHIWGNQLYFKNKTNTITTKQ